MNVSVVGVLSVNYASETALSSLLDSIPAASTGSHVKVVVADNKPDPSEKVRDLVEAHGGVYLAMPSNRGYGHAINAAVKKLPVECEWVLICNPDVVLGEASLDILVQRGYSNPRIASVGPRILNVDGSTYPSARSIPSVGVGVGHALLSNVWPANPWSSRYLVTAQPGFEPQARPAGWLSGSCLLVRRSAFEEIGGFDDDYFMYFEDTDLGFRFKQAGYLNMYEPQASVVHEGAHSTRRESVAMVKAHHESAKRFVRRRYSGPLLWPVRVLLYGGLTLRSYLLSQRAMHTR